MENFRFIVEVSEEERVGRKERGLEVYFMRGVPVETLIGKRSTRGGRREPQTLVRNP